MRNFVFNNTRPNEIPHKQLEQYCSSLNTDINSLIHYIRYFAPNYKILNYSPGLEISYYTNQELIEKGYILPVQILSVEDYTNRVLVTTDGDANGESSLIVFPNKLELHEGLLNRFPEYDHSPVGVLLYYGSVQEIPMITEVISDTTYHFIPADVLMFDYVHPNYKIVSNNSSATTTDCRL